jgi:hypothetical protein
MSYRQITTDHLNVALDLAAKCGLTAKDITSVDIADDGEGVTVGIGLADDGLARFVSSRGFGL